MPATSKTSADKPSGSSSSTEQPQPRAVGVTEPSPASLASLALMSTQTFSVSQGNAPEQVPSGQLAVAHILL